MAHLKYVVFLILTLAVAWTATAQQNTVKDMDIVNALLGKSYYKMHPTLDSLGVWYTYHKFESGIKGYEPEKDRVYSIANSDGTAKVWILELTEQKIIREIMINFRHDDKEQVEDSKKMAKPAEYKNGYYSTDMVYRWKSK